MRYYKIKAIPQAFACLIFLLTVPLSGFTQNLNYEIVLKNGSSIEVSEYYEEGDKLFYQKFGGTMGIEKSKIKEIKKVKRDPNIVIIPYIGNKEKKEDPNIVTIPSNDYPPHETDYDIELDIVTGVIEKKPFSIYQSALKSKQKGDYLIAKEKLTYALTLIKPTESNFKTIEDELYYHLPLDEVRSLMVQGHIDRSMQILQSIEKYIQGHPKQYQYLQIVHNISNSILRMVCAKVETDALNAGAALANYFAYPTHINLPSTTELFRQMGYTPTNRIELSGSPNDTIRIVVHDVTGRCRQGNRLVYTMPGGVKQWQ